MREIIEASAKAGVRVLVLDPPGVLQREYPAVPVGTPQPIAPPPASGAAPTPPGPTMAEFADLQGRFMALSKERDGLVGQVEAARKAALASGASDPTLGPKLAQAESSLIEAIARAKRAEEALELARKAPPAANGIAAPANGTQAPPSPSMDDYGLDVLGLDADVAKKLQKKGLDTIGKLRVLCGAGTFSAQMKDAKLTKDEATGVAEKLIGKVPPANVSPVGGPIVASSSVHDPKFGDPKKAPPTGHIDQTWIRRLESARSREDKLIASRADAAAKKQVLIAKWPQAITVDGEAEKLIVPGGIKPEEFPEFFARAQDYSVADGVVAIHNGQVRALLFSLNLDPNAKSLDGALQAANLIHLMSNAATSTPPAPTAPPPAAPVAPAPAAAGAP